VSRCRIARCARSAARIHRVLQGISYFFALQEQSWLQKGAKFLAEKIARPSEKIAGTGMLPH